MKVPYNDLRAHNAPHRGAFSAAIEEVIDRGEFSGGRYVEEFEGEFAEFCGTRHAIGVSSGTDALWLALSGLGIGPGDEVITVSMTFIATAEAITRTGARPVFVDIDDVSYTLDPQKLEAAYTEKTKAIVPVHLFGQIAKMALIREFADRRGIVVVEDAAQAHGAVYQGKRAGSLAHAGCFSFYPGKNLGAFGEAGAISTNDSDLAANLREVRDHGQRKKYFHSSLGWNCRMDGIQAAVLKVKLKYLDRNNQRRRQIAEQYREALGGIFDLKLPDFGDPGSHVHHIFAVRVQDRSGFIDCLASNSIGHGIHYPIPVHLQAACSDLGYCEGSIPISEAVAKDFVSLPLFPEMTKEQIEQVVCSVQAATRTQVRA